MSRPRLEGAKISAGLAKRKKKREDSGLVEVKAHSRHKPKKK